jgi:acylphosphatase
VQGVGFRYFAVEAARRAGVTGTVRNQRDGSVEAIAEGSRDKLAAFRFELERGPTFSRVTSVDEQEIQPSNRYTDFDISY